MVLEASLRIGGNGVTTPIKSCGYKTISKKSFDARGAFLPILGQICEVVRRYYEKQV